MYEDYDFFDDLDDDLPPESARKSKWEHLNEEWLSALESSDVDQIGRTLITIDEAMTDTWSQIAIYRNAPSQRKRWQTEEWYSRAMGAHGSYSKMVRALERHRTLLVERDTARRIAKELEVERRDRLKEAKAFLLNYELLKARVKLLTVKHERLRSREEKGRFIALISQMGILRDYDMKDLWDKTRAMGKTVREEQSEREVALWKDRLEEAKAKARELNARGVDLGAN